MSRLISRLTFQWYFYMLFGRFNVSQFNIRWSRSFDISWFAATMQYILSLLSRKSFQYIGLLEQAFNELFLLDYPPNLSSRSLQYSWIDRRDIDNNERELKYIISSFSVSQPDQLSSIENAFLVWNKFDVLIPKLMKYFDRIVKSMQIWGIKNYFILKVWLFISTCAEIIWTSI